MKKMCCSCFRENDFPGLVGSNCTYCKKSFSAAFKPTPRLEPPAIPLMKHDKPEDFDQFPRSKSQNANRKMPAVRDAWSKAINNKSKVRDKFINNNSLEPVEVDATEFEIVNASQEFDDNIDQYTIEMTKQELQGSVSEDDIIVGSDDQPERLQFDMSKVRNNK